MHSPLMIRIPGLAQPGARSAAIVETVDLFPTLTELCGLPPPAGLDGRSLRPQLLNPAIPGTKPAIGFWINGQRTVRTAQWRLIAQAGAASAVPPVELFDFNASPTETRQDPGTHPDVVAKLLAQLPNALR